MIFNEALFTQLNAAAIQAAQQSLSVKPGWLWQSFAQLDMEDFYSFLETQDRDQRPLAIPLEPPNSNLPPIGEPFNLWGVDGSQIYFDLENPVKWGFVQAGSYHPEEQAIVVSRFFDLHVALDKNIYAILSSPNNFINQQRTQIEMQVVIETLTCYPEDLVLLDLPLQPKNNPASDLQLFQPTKHIQQLLSLSGKKLAGYISGPKSKHIMDLVNLVKKQTTRLEHPLQYVSDSSVLAYGLSTGYRSALFKYLPPSPLEKEPVSIYFFFVKISDDEIARIEIPEWLAKPELIGQIHTSILLDCIGLNYPAVLAMAHNQIRLTGGFEKLLKEKAFATFLEHGGRFRVSAKNKVKGV